MRNFCDIHRVSSHALCLKIEQIRVILEEYIAQESNTLFITIKHLQLVEDKILLHKRLWIYYVILKWLLVYADYESKLMTREVVDKFAVHFNNYLTEENDDAFIEQISALE